MPQCGSAASKTYLQCVTAIVHYASETGDNCIRFTKLCCQLDSTFFCSIYFLQSSDIKVMHEVCHVKGMETKVEGTKPLEK